MKATLSILGLWMQDPTIFNSLHLPAGVDLATVRDTILYDLADLEVLYPSAPFMKTMIDLWSTKENPTWTRLYTAMQLEYNPLENYDRQEDWTDTRDDTRTLLDTLDGEVKNTGTVTNVLDGEVRNTGTVTTVTDGESETTTVTDGTTQNYVAGYNEPSLVLSSKTDEDTTVTANTTVDNTDTETRNTTTTTDNTTTDTLNTKVETDNTRNATDSLDGETVHSGRVHGNIGVTTSQQMLKSELDLVPQLNIINYIVHSFKMRFCVLVY